LICGSFEKKNYEPGSEGGLGPKILRAQMNIIGLVPGGFDPTGTHQ
jgi:hypothetical protein